MNNSIQSRLVAIDNEQRGQKVSRKLNYGSLGHPDQTPSENWDGNIGNAFSSIDPNVVVRWIATFTRTDGVDGAPLVQFPWKYTLDRGTYDDQIAMGAITGVSGRDKRAIDDVAWNDGIWEVGSNYVKWKIELVGAQGSWHYAATNGTGVHITATAVSPVPGNLILEKVA